MTLEVGPGDVLAVLGSDDVFSKGIRFFEDIDAAKLIPVDHCLIVTKQDQVGRWLAIQGDSNGVGITDVARFLDQPQANVNHLQPRDPTKVPEFLANCAAAMGLAYDWVGIAIDALDDLRLYPLADAIDHLWRWPTSQVTLPGHVVCSSLAAWAYKAVGWAHPAGDERRVQPSDWWQWNRGERWAP